MAFELERVLYETEDFLRRALRSPAARAAKKRRMRRKLDEMLRRLKRSAWILAGLLVLLVAAGLFGKLGFLALLLGVPTAFFIAFLSLFWSKGGRRAATAPGVAPPPATALDALARRAEDDLIDRCRDLPGRALPAADAIVARLDELQPHLGALDPASTLAGDARRLIGEHLPRLIDSYLALPDADRGPRSESSTRFTESLAIVAEEMDRLLDRCCRDRHARFETQSRFIETRYKEDKRLRGD
jgi:hypothetical protein